MPLKAPKDRHAFDRLVKIMAQLRSPKGCPWDRVQTHKSLKPYLVEECYEVLEAIDSGDPQKLKKELGDLLLQAVFHAQVAAEKRSFNIYDVAAAIADKLVTRHPHVFGSTKVKDAAEQSLRWEEIKRKEKEHAGRSSIVDGVPKAMPALLRARRVLSKASKARFKWNNKKDAWKKFDEELGEFKRARGKRHKEEELGDLLLALVNVARWEDLEPEHCLRQGTRKFERRVQAMESGARREKKKIEELGSAELMTLWKAAKKREKNQKKNSAR